MRSVPKLQLADNGVYYIHWTAGRRSKRISTRQKDPGAARAFFGDWLRGEKTRESVVADVADVAAAPAKLSMLTCADLWTFYDEMHVQKRVVDTETHRHAWNRLEPSFGHLKPSDVTQKLVDKHIKSRLPAKPSTVRTELNLLLTSWHYGVKKRKILSTELPVDLDLPEPPLPRERWLRPEEANKLFDVLASKRSDRLSRVERFVWIALETAARLTAILELKWDQVDWETCVIHFNPEGRRQTKKRRASVPISNALMQILLRAWDESESEYVLDRPTSVQDALNAAVDEAGLVNVTPHVFRHTAATWLARRGVPLFHISKILGNSLEEVERTYAKHCPDDLRDCIELINQTRVLQQPRTWQHTGKSKDWLSRPV
jgi:integrase